MKHGRNRNSWRRRPLSAFSLPALILTFLMAAGISCGYLFAVFTSEQTAEQLGSFWALYASGDAAQDAVSFFSLLFCYLRAPALILLFGFSSLGFVCLPLVCGVEGFLLSFSLCSFALSLGMGHLPLLLGIYFLRLLFLLPAVLLLSLDAWKHSSCRLSSGKRGHTVLHGEAAYLYRFGCAVLLLCLCSAAEFWLTPHIVSACGGLF